MPNFLKVLLADPRVDDLDPCRENRMNRVSKFSCINNSLTPLLHLALVHHVKPRSCHKPPLLSGPYNTNSLDSADGTVPPTIFLVVGTVLSSNHYLSKTVENV